MGRVSPNTYVQDGVFRGQARRSARKDPRAKNAGIENRHVFHAGDGNLHPLICYDEQIAGQGELAEKVAQRSDVLHRRGGSITGEHGVGADKSASMGKMFSEVDLETMQLLRCAFDPATSAIRESFSNSAIVW